LCQIVFCHFCLYRAVSDGALTCLSAVVCLSRTECASPSTAQESYQRPHSHQPCSKTHPGLMNFSQGIIQKVAPVHKNSLRQAVTNVDKPAP
jgi:hypothetical protein